MSEKYDPDGQVVRSQTIVEDINSSSEQRTTGGATGVSANVPEKAGTTEAAARPTSVTEQNRKNRTTNYEINRVTTISPAIRARYVMSQRPCSSPPCDGRSRRSGWQDHG